MSLKEEVESRVYLVAGEASGDRLAADLLRELKKNPKLRAFGVGGPMLKAAGQEQSFDLAKHAVVGLTDVLRNLPKFLKIFREVKHEIAEIHPDVVILVDYPGFNLRLARALHREPGAPALIYYVSPQVWAWKAGRAKLMEKILERLLVIFPFEVDWFAQHAPKLRTRWVGHPLPDRWIHQSHAERDEIPSVALLPGSRAKEIDQHWPILLKTAQRIVQEERNVRFISMATDHEMRQRLEEIWAKSPMSGVSLDIVSGQSLTQLTRCSLAIVASGTATLECAMAGLPMLVIYRASWLTYWVARMLVKLPYLSMVNVLAGEKVVPEFLQGAAEPERLARAALQILRNPKGAEVMADRIRKVAKKLGGPGAASRAAREVEDAIRARRKLVIAAKKSVRDSEEGSGRGA
ncbi:MAG: lipid-A-disaccharide synthase [Verrucomicrobia bacterium]|nr:lipid-A-disaccharide synthase [Verrucomicrobiota bacterium]MDA0858165.1 lipid-A-disaccharide synthase [Verrucomicrobiota bacterium]MDA1340632.1 lipid-A-disaccharide synthase [Verrucomicrobiota bacterium]